MDESATLLPFDLLESFIIDVFCELGVPKEEAKICADVLLTADKRGIESHGISRLKTLYYDRIKANIQNPITKIKIVKDGPTSTVIDGHHGMGQVVSYKAMDIAIKKAKSLGLGMSVVRNSTHFGIAGYYLLQAINQGMIGICGTNARPSIAPTFGVENMLGTNPLSFGMPTDEDFPFVLDCATSISQRGMIEAYERQNKVIPSSWVVGSTSSTQTDAHQVLEDLAKGQMALTPLGGIGEEFAGYKGYGYATVVEILSSALQDGAFMKALTGYDQSGNRQPYQLGHFFIAINVEAFISLEKFKVNIGNILRELRNSKKAPGQTRIYTAGEKEHLAWLEREGRGLYVHRELQKDIIQIQKDLNLNKYCFPFS